jgi:glycosyltransferase involved in cell wall biosynthesis
MTTVAFIVNGDQHSAMGERASAFDSHLRNRYSIRIAYRSKRKLMSLVRFILFLVRTKPQIAYVFDMSYSGVMAALLYRLVSGSCLIIDTGDAICELAQSMGRSGIKLWLTRILESISLSMADRIVVRGTFHQQLLSKRGIHAELIQDGVDTNQFAPFSKDELQSSDRTLTVGVLGSSVWSEKLQWCYGLELVETLRLLKDLPVRAVMIGDGSGIAHLESLCRQYGIQDRISFHGRVPYSELPAQLKLIDVCLSTQTNDVVGRVRTTGKLPLYMAAGRYVLASKVGEAALVLHEDMLIEHEGAIDIEYAQKLAHKIESLLDNPEKLVRGLDNVLVAKSHFDYSVLAETMAGLFDQSVPAATEMAEYRNSSA